MNTLIYFSSKSEYTQRFVDKLKIKSLRIPSKIEKNIQTYEPYILILPSYGGGLKKGAVPNQVINFLNNSLNRSLLRGIIGAGNRNFGKAFCIAGNIVAQKCQVPLLYCFELIGTSEDVVKVQKGVSEFWKKQKK